MQKRLGQRGEQIFLVVEIAVEHRGGFPCGRCDVRQGGAVEATLREQLSSGLLDRIAGLSTLRAQRLFGHAHGPSSRSPARSSAPGSWWPMTRCATRAAAIAASR